MMHKHIYLMIVIAVSSLIFLSCYVYGKDREHSFVSGDEKHGVSFDFDEVWKIIHRESLTKIKHTSVHKRLCRKEMMSSSLSHCLNDAYARYYSRQAMETFKNKLNSFFVGIGIMFVQASNKAIVHDVFQGSPADVSGKFRAGDLIIGVDGVDVRNRSVLEVIDAIKGEEGVPISIVVERNGVRQEPIVLTQAKVYVPSVYAVDINNETTYIRMSQFLAQTPGEFLEIVAKRISFELPHNKIVFFPEIHNFILDLRGNPGGLLNAAGLLSYFFASDPSHIFLTIKSQSRETTMRMKTYLDAGIGFQPGLLAGLHVAVLIDKNSASAAEIFAAFLRETIAAPLIGVRTFGKGSIQSMFTLKHGNGIYLTTAHYLVGNRKVSVDKMGVLPDYYIDMSEASAVFGNNSFFRLSEQIDFSSDPQLKKAMEVLKEKHERKD